MWYFAIGGQTSGPATVEEIRDLLGRGAINSGTLVWRDGWAEWSPLADSVLSRMLSKPPPLPFKEFRVSADQPHAMAPPPAIGAPVVEAASIKKPSTWLYIAAWVVASTLGAIVSTLVDHLMAAMILKSRDDFDLYFFVAPLSQFFATLLIWISIYSLFRSLNISRVMPFIWVLGSLGVMVNVGRTYSEFEKASLTVPGVYFVSVITGFGAFVLLFRSFFKARARLLG
jgi:hypothetical protein